MDFAPPSRKAEQPGRKERLERAFYSLLTARDVFVRLENALSEFPAGQTELVFLDDFYAPMAVRHSPAHSGPRTAQPISIPVRSKTLYAPFDANGIRAYQSQPGKVGFWDANALFAAANSDRNAGVWKPHTEYVSIFAIPEAEARDAWDRALARATSKARADRRSLEMWESMARNNW
ncbi:MAG: hypothetical protein HY554_13670 [Elusimicrobia bacterium]|nr:hypothetical protein [Elusimicrobiota bacterium]